MLGDVFGQICEIWINFILVPVPVSVAGRNEPSSWGIDLGQRQFLHPALDRGPRFGACVWWESGEHLHPHRASAAKDGRVRVLPHSMCACDHDWNHRNLASCGEVPGSVRERQLDAEYRALREHHQVVLLTQHVDLAFATSER